ncbi:MAG: DUF1361 domain-containing protein [Chloroflexota bacterium]|nr:DUF1361 domain-containing protein [Chloroflexota bacterium]
MLQDIHTLHPLNLLLVGLLLLPMIGSACLFTVVTVGLLFARAKIFRQRVYKPMLFNLFLAWIPIICVGVALLAFLASVLRGEGLLWVTIVLLGIWFVFFPNSTYLVTEFHHLRDEKADIPYWFDTIMILALALCGLLLGSFSLLLVQQLLLIYLPGPLTWVLFVAYLFLSNVGIYIGRFLRFNSWDVLANPFKLLTRLGKVWQEKQTRRQLLLFASLFTLFLLTFYLFLYSAVEPVASALLLVIQHPGIFK